MLVPTPPDLLLQTWIKDAGIIVNKNIKIITSPQSVGGRGVFAFAKLEEGDPIAFIPSSTIFNLENSAAYFPKVADKIKNSKANAKISAQMGSGRKIDWIHKMWRKVMRREEKSDVRDFRYASIDDDFWQLDLSIYAHAIMEEKHPWSIWMSQWSRADPINTLFVSNPHFHDDDKINVAVDDLLSMMPFLSRNLIYEVLSFKLGRFQEQRIITGSDDNSELAAFYANIGSRAVALNFGGSGVIPFHDMINHSLDPNLSMLEDKEGMKIFAKRDIEEGEELLNCYTDKDEPMDELNAVIALVQWGIPTPEIDICDLSISKLNVVA